MKVNWSNVVALTAAAAAVFALVTANLDRDRPSQILNVSYDPTREVFAALNARFVAKYEHETGKDLTIKQSHGGSSGQAQTVIEGLKADVVTLALSSDVEALRKHGLVAEGWAKRLPHDSHPYTSTIVFVVRKGNPKRIADWPDLVRPGVLVVTPNPKTSGNGKLAVLAAWGSVIYRGGTETQAREYLVRLFEHVPTLGTAARDSTATFTHENEGDAQLTWEHEALRETSESHGELETVYPPVSIRAEPAVAWVDAIVSSRKTQAFAEAYLKFLYSDEAQEMLAEYGYRPIEPEVLKRHADRLPGMNLFPITLLAKDWEEAQIKFFADNGIFDVIYKPKVQQ